MQSKIISIRDSLRAMFPERQDVITGLLATLLSRQHALLIGPPGTAKSALIRALSGAFGLGYFEWLLSKFSTPEELFGPISLRALEQDRFARVTTGKLPECEIAFVDEVFKANSAILNSMLSVINERVFHNDGSVMRCPLLSMFGASNELPEGKELEALFDRFLLRYELQYLRRPSNFRAMVLAPNPETQAPSMTVGELEIAFAQVDAVRLTKDTVDALIKIRDVLSAEGIVASDRRWKQSLQLVKATAYLDGGQETCPEDLSILADCLWREPKDRAKIAGIIGKEADPVSAQAQEIVDAARESAAEAQKKAGTEDYMQAATRVVGQLKQQATMLEKLRAKAGRKANSAIDAASAELSGIRADFAKALSSGLGL